ncbi:MAG TPA: hypothetical protein VMT06_02420, partial [Candidatus Eisenbacteria bacterium]|nr:hypothetical protein [Candidatus Eisenbacteria bacterium]
VNLESLRKFVVLEQDFTGMSPSKITESTIQLVKGSDGDGVVIVPLIKGTLPAEASRTEVDVSKIRASAEKALLVHPVFQLRESQVSEEAVRSIFESRFTDLKTKAFEYFLKIFSERYAESESERMARAAVSLVEPLTKKDEDRVKKTIEELLQ